jgi:hypothetical protein
MSQLHDPLNSTQQSTMVGIKQQSKSTQANGQQDGSLRAAIVERIYSFHCFKVDGADLI